MLARDHVALVLGFDWTAVTVAIIAAVASITTALLNAVVIYMLRTPSGTRIGKQVENSLHVGLSNSYRAQRIEKHLGLDQEDAP